MNRILSASIALALALVITAQPVRPVSSSASPLIDSAATRTLASPLHAPKEKPDRVDPAWLVYWRWMMYR